MPPTGPAGNSWSPPAPRKRTRRRLWITLGVVGALVVIGVIGNATGGGNPKPSAGELPPYTPPPVAGYTPEPEPTFSPTTESAETTTVAPAPAAHTLLALNGTGIKNTGTFDAPEQWTLSYSFDCSNFGSEGNFSVVVYEGGDPVDFLANALATHGKSSTEAYDSGRVHLQINSECNWSIKVTG